MKNHPSLLDFKNVSVIRGEKNALESITFKINEGENVAILGPNGSGKSTLIKTITREYYPTGGSLKLFGRERWHVYDLRDLLGIVTPDLEETFRRDITGFETVLSGFFSSVGLWMKDKATPPMKKRAREVMRLLHISHLSDRFMTDMSTGELKRFLVGRALVRKPKAMILDEPTNSLDVSALKKFQTSLRHIEKAGCSLIMVTHHLHDIIPEIKRVILLKEGEIFKDGPKKDILTSKNLSALFDVSVKVFQQNGFYHLV